MLVDGLGFTPLIALRCTFVGGSVLAAEAVYVNATRLLCPVPVAVPSGAALQINEGNSMYSGVLLSFFPNGGDTAVVTLPPYITGVVQHFAHGTYADSTVIVTGANFNQGTTFLCSATVGNRLVCSL